MFETANFGREVALMNSTWDDCIALKIVQFAVAMLKYLAAATAVV